jgi:hypothetical protein
MARYPEQLIKSAFLSLDLHFYRYIPISVVICYFHKEINYGFYVRNLNILAKSPTHCLRLLTYNTILHKVRFVYDESRIKYDIPLPVT